MPEISKIGRKLGDNRAISADDLNGLIAYINREVTPVLAECRNRLNEVIDAVNDLEERVSALEP